MSFFSGNKIRKYVIKNYDTIFLYCLMFLICTLIVSMQRGFRWNSWGIILVSIIWLLGKANTYKFSTIYKDKFVLLHLLYFLLFIIGLIHTEYFKDAKHGIEVRLSFLALPLIISSSAKIVKTSFNKLLLVFIAANFIGTLLLYANGKQVFSDFLFMVSKLILHRPYFGMYIVFCIATLAYLISKSKNRLIQILYLVLIFYFLYFMFVIQVRMATVALIAGGTIVTLFYFTCKRKYLLASIFLITGIISSYYGWTKAPTKYKDLVKSAFKLELVPYNLYSVNVGHSYNLRMLTWHCALEIIEDNLLIGVGTGDNTEELVKCYEDKNEYIYEMRFNSHNEYFQEAIRHGLVGLIVFLSMLSISFYYALKKKSMLYLFFIILISICFTTEAVLSRQAGVVFYTTFSSILYSYFVINDD